MLLISGDKGESEMQNLSSIRKIREHWRQQSISVKICCMLFRLRLKLFSRTNMTYMWKNPMLQNSYLLFLCYCHVINIFLIHPGLLLLFLHTWGSTSWLLFDYQATIAGLSITQLHSLFFNHQMPPVCTARMQSTATAVSFLMCQLVHLFFSARIHY